VLLLLPLTSLLTYAIISVQYFKIKQTEEFAKLFSTILAIPIAPIIIVFIVFSVGFAKLSGVMELPNQRWVFIYMAVFCFLLNVIEVANIYFITAQKTKWYAIFNLIKVAVESTLTLYFVVYRKMGWEGRIHSWFITSIIFTSFAFLIFYRERLLTWSLNKRYAIASLVFGLPLIWHTIGKLVVNQSDRLFIAKMISLDEAGIYNVGYTIGAMIMILISSLNNYYSPTIMKNLTGETESGRRNVVRANYQFLSIMVVGFILLNITSPFLFRWVIDKRYAEGNLYVFWISLGYLFWGGYMLFVPIIYFHNKTKYLGFLAIINVTSNIVLNYLLIPKLSGLGAALATLISFVIIFVFVAIKSNSIQKLPWLKINGYTIFKFERHTTT